MESIIKLEGMPKGHTARSYKAEENYSNNFIDQETTMALGHGEGSKVCCKVSSDLTSYYLPGDLLETIDSQSIKVVQDSKGEPMLFAVMGQAEDLHIVMSTSSAGMASKPKRYFPAISLSMYGEAAIVATSMFLSNLYSGSMRRHPSCLSIAARIEPLANPRLLAQSLGREIRNVPPVSWTLRRFILSPLFLKTLFKD